MKNQTIIYKFVECCIDDFLLREASVQSYANAGDVAEGILGAAIVARFLRPVGDITQNDVFGVIKQLNANKNTSGSGNVIKQITFNVPPNPKLKKAQPDSITLRVGLNPNSFKGLVSATYFRKQAAIVLSAIKFASSEGILSHALKVYNDPNKNIITVSSVGTENQKGTKVDLRISIDDTVIPWGLLSLKAGGTKQLGQIGKGWRGDPEKASYTRGISDLFETLFGIQIDERLKKPYTDALAKGSRKSVLVAIDNVYRNAYGKIAKRFDGDETELIDLLRTLAAGVSHEATLGEKGVVLVQLGNKDFEALDFGKLDQIFEEEELEIEVEYRPAEGKDGVPYIMINMVVNGKDFGRLISIRPKIRFSGTRLSEFRHYVQKELGLKKLIAMS